MADEDAITIETTVDDWGFTDADHTELQALMTKYQADAYYVILDLMLQGGVAAPREILGAGTLIIGSNGQARAFPPGGFWWALLDRLRALDRAGEKGGRR